MPRSRRISPSKAATAIPSTASASTPTPTRWVLIGRRCATAAQCALTGVTPAQFGHIGPNPAFQYNGQFTGNPNLVPEVADTYTVGLMLQPRVVPNLSLSLDYFHIKIDGRVGPVGGDAIL